MSMSILRGRVLIASVAVVGAGLLLPSNLSAAGLPQGGLQEGVCEGSHVSGSSASITVTASAGMLISGYCVKAGSIQQGDGPEYVTLNPPQASVTISHSSGKTISHYVVQYVEAPTTTSVAVTTSSVEETTTTAAETTTTVGGDGGTTTLAGDNGTTTLVGGDSGTASPTQASTPAMLPATGSTSTPMVVTAFVVALAGSALLTLVRRRTT